MSTTLGIDPMPTRTTAVPAHWARTDDLRVGTPRVHGPSSGRGLAVAVMPAGHEYRRVRAFPHLYDESLAQNIIETFLTAYGLTEWPCDTCDHLNLTPDHLFSVDTPCAACGAA